MLIHIQLIYTVFLLIHLVDEKPEFQDLQKMTYSGEDGNNAIFRLMERLKPHILDVAIALRFPRHKLAVIRDAHKDQVYDVLSYWLQGANKEEDPRPVTWKTLITVLKDANMQEDARVLEKCLVAEDGESFMCSYMW